MGKYGQPACDTAQGNPAGNFRKQEGWAPFHIGTGKPMFRVEARNGQLLLLSADGAHIHWSFLLKPAGQAAPWWVSRAEMPAHRAANPDPNARPGDIVVQVGDRPNTSHLAGRRLSLVSLVKAALEKRELIEVGSD